MNSCNRNFSSIVVDGNDRAPNRSMLRAVGFEDEDFEKPQVAVCSAWSMVTPCNSHLDELGKASVEGVDHAGGKVVPFGTITVSDGISMGSEGMKYSLVSREVIADSIETVVGCQSYDGLVTIGGCDKNMPGCLIAIARLNRPAVFVYGGTILPGTYKGQDVDIVAACTNAMQPALKGEWLQRGQHVTDVRGELDSEVFKRADVVVKQGVAHSRPRNEDSRHMGEGFNNGDYIGGTEEEKKRLPQRHADSKVGAGGDDKTPTFNDLASGNIKRTTKEQITLYLNSGNQGLQFAAVGGMVYQKAREQGLGKELPTEWFLQDIRD